MLERLGRDERVHAVVLPRTAEQRAAIRGLGLPSLVVPDRAVDAQSLIAAAAAVVSAGGTMNREAVALGTPVYTTFGGRLGAVDEALIRDGRLVRLERAAQLDLDALPPRRERLRRDPNVLLDLLPRLSTGTRIRAPSRDQTGPSRRSSRVAAREASLDTRPDDDDRELVGRAAVRSRNAIRARPATTPGTRRSRPRGRGAEHLALRIGDEESPTADEGKPRPSATTRAASRCHRASVTAAGVGRLDPTEAGSGRGSAW